MSNTLALCVGINKYENFPKNGLNGCVNDCNEWALFLSNRFDSETIVLTDKKATKENIMTILIAFVKSANEDTRIKRVWFTLSGHGSQQRDQTNEESDGLTEIFLTYNSKFGKRGFVQNTIITDDELWTLGSKLRKNCLFEVVLDTCHSGTGLRFVSQKSTARYIQNPMLFLDGLVAKREPVHTQLPQAVLWAGCKDDESSLDVCLGDDIYRGAASWALLSSFYSNEKKKRSQLIKAAQTLLDSSEFDQHVQLEAKTKYKNLPIE